MVIARASPAREAAQIAVFGTEWRRKVDWLLVWDIAADGGALASTAIAMLFGYRALTISIKEETIEADLQRQSDCATYAGVAGALAAVSFGVGLIAL
jgi:hypothetical protein